MLLRHTNSTTGTCSHAQHVTVRYGSHESVSGSQVAGTTSCSMVYVSNGHPLKSAQPADSLQGKEMIENMGIKVVV